MGYLACTSDTDGSTLYDLQLRHPYCVTQNYKPYIQGVPGGMCETSEECSLC